MHACLALFGPRVQALFACKQNLHAGTQRPGQVTKWQLLFIRPAGKQNLRAALISLEPIDRGLFRRTAGYLRSTTYRCMLPYIHKRCQLKLQLQKRAFSPAGAN